MKLGRNVPKGLLGDVFGCGERERAARSPIHQGKVELGVWSSHIIDQFNCHASKAKWPGFQKVEGKLSGWEKMGRSAPPEKAVRRLIIAVTSPPQEPTSERLVEYEVFASPEDSVKSLQRPRSS